MPAATVDPSTGRISVVFTDRRFRKDFKNDIVIVHSDNEGATWSKPARVNAGPTDDLTAHFTPAITAGPGNTVRVMWRQQSGPDDPYASTWIAQSADGVHFGRAVHVDRGVNDVRFAAWSDDAPFQGDYDQMVTIGATSYLVYCDSWALPGVPPPVRTRDWTPHHQRAMVSVVS
jgi:hypothetical protein